MAGGVIKSIAMKQTKSGVISSADWRFNEIEFESLFTTKNKVLLMNRPNNPLGKVFDMEELMLIAKMAKKWNVLVISDEVYEHMVFEPKKHIRINTLPGMWDRTITIGSAGKTFSVTGWKIGWSYGPAKIMRNLQMVHQYTVGNCAAPLQEAVALAFEHELPRINSPDCYFNILKQELLLKRNYMVTFLKETGFDITLPEGGFFITANWTKLESKADLSTETDAYRDFRFTKWMTKNILLLGLPTSAFFTQPNKLLGENFVRYCYMKKEETLRRAKSILKNWNMQI